MWLNFVSRVLNNSNSMKGNVTMTKINLIILVLTLSACGAKSGDQSSAEHIDLESIASRMETGMGDQCSEHFVFGLPAYRDKVLTTICHQGYLIAFDEQSKIPRYTSHEITINNTLIYVDRLASYVFNKDPSINEFSQANSKDYYGSGYDRGHMQAWGDSSLLEEALESNYYTNIVPQLPALNRGVWLNLEKAIRSYVLKTSNDIFVITGAIEGNTYIGNNVEVPNGFFKVLYDPHNEKMTAYVVFQHDVLTKPLNEYSLSVDELELLIGIDLYPKMEQFKQETLESSILWKL